MSWVGIDVSKNHLDICMLAQTGELQHNRVENTKPGFNHLSQSLKPQSHIVIEATGNYHQKVQKHLQEVSA